MKKKLIASALLISACFALAGCSEDSGETLKGQTDATMGKNVKHVKDPAMSYTKINHSVTFKGEHVPTHYSIVRDSHGRRKKIEGYTKWSKDTVGGSLTSEEKKMITKYGNRIEGSFRLK